MNQAWLLCAVLLSGGVATALARPDGVRNRFTSALGLGDSTLPGLGNSSLPGMDEFDINKLKCKGSSFAGGSSGGGKSGFGGFDKIPGLGNLGGGSDCEEGETTSTAAPTTTTAAASE